MTQQTLAPQQQLDLPSLHARLLACLGAAAPAFQFGIDAQARIIARLYRCELHSHFLPIVDAARPTQVYGHQGRLVGREGNNAHMKSSELQDVARSCGVIQQFNYVDNALHLCNYFLHAPDTYRLHLAPAPALFADIGGFCEQLAGLLALLSVAPDRLTLRIPDSLLVSFKSAAPLLPLIAVHGFRLALGLPKRFDLLRKLRQVQAIHLVQFDPGKRSRESNINQLMQQIGGLGAITLCSNILDPRQNEKLVEAGASLLCGLGIAPPSAHISPGLLPPFPWAKQA